MTTGTAETVVARRRRVVVRPRLIRALDGASARSRLLVAPAGYGKTTLAEQWIASGERSAAWYTARSASADVAVLSSALAQAAATIVDGCDARLCERLTSTQSPADDAAVLAEMLAEDLAEWPREAWLVIDDYERLCRAAEAEEFVDVLVSSAPVNLLVASRQRPSWVSSRDILYGDVFELGQTALAMTLEEAEEVLSEWPSEQASGLTRLADGWPAVVGLAGLTSAPAGIDVEVPDALYEFFAEEVYESLSEETRQGLALLAVAPVLDRELAAAILGEEGCEAVCREALAKGILDDRRGRFELHPLARGFLETRMSNVEGRSKAVRRALRHYRDRHDWDAAFDLVERHDIVDEVDSLLREALDELLDGARLATITTWIEHARMASVDTPMLRLAQAELACRDGRAIVATTLAESVIKHDPPKELGYRALAIAGLAAHMSSREVEGLGYFREAETMATSEQEVRSAQMGQVMCAGALEREEAQELVEFLAGTVNPEDPVDRVRLADRQLSVGCRFGHINQLDEALEVAALIPHVANPVIRCSFRSMLAYTLGLTADYQRAKVIADELIADAVEFRIDMAEPYGWYLRAVALSGLRQFELAHQALDIADEQLRRINDYYGMPMHTR
jgi:ATP/maltotriose-dependent transcriptional regulator MalT